MQTSRRAALGLLCATLAGGAAGAAPLAAAGEIEELVVTAERRPQALQSVPIALSAYTADQRDRLGILTVQDISNFTPGLQYSSGLDRLSLRGAGRLTSVLASDPGVATYSDGVYTSSTVEAGKPPLFVERVEILRGPQGTLYGRNAIAGAINVISKRPTDAPQAEVRASYGDYGRTTLQGVISGPLAPGLRARLGGGWEKQSDGYFRNLVQGLPSEGGVVDQKYAELQFDMDIGARLHGWVKLAVMDWHNGSGGGGSRTSWNRPPQAGVPGPYNTTEFSNQAIGAGFAYSGLALNVQANGVTPDLFGDPRVFAADTPERVRLDNTFILATEWTWRGDGFDVKYTGGGTTYRLTLTQDNDGTAVQSFQVPLSPVFLSGAATPCVRNPQCGPLTIFPRTVSVYQEDKHWFSHEFNLASNRPGPWQWLVGAYLYHEAFRQPAYNYQPDQLQLRAPLTTSGTAAPGNPEGRLYDDRPEMEDRTYALYGQADWAFAAGWKTTLGLRYTHDHKSGTEAFRSICFGLPSCLNGLTPNGLGSLTPAVDVTRAVVFTSGVPQGVAGPLTFDALGFAHRDYDASWQALTGTAGVQWTPDPQTMTYLRYSRGYKAGGFNVGISTVVGPFPYTGPEHANAFEAGLKKRWRRLQANLAVFYLDYRDLQAPLTVANTSGAIAVSESRLLNVPRARSYGVELEAVWSPVERLQITATYAYLNATIRRLSGVVDSNDPAALDPSARPLTPLTRCAAGQPLCDVYTGFVQRPQDLAGNQLPQAAKNKLAINALYTWRFQPGALSASASYIWRDRQYGSVFTRGYNKSPAWDQVDARLTWTGAGDRYTVIAYVKNLFDTLGYEGGATATRRAASFANAIPVDIAGVARNTNLVEGLVSSYPLTPPRTFGVEVQYRF